MMSCGLRNHIAGGRCRFPHSLTCSSARCRPIVDSETAESTCCERSTCCESLLRGAWLASNIRCILFTNNKGQDSVHILFTNNKGRLCTQTLSHGPGSICKLLFVRHALLIIDVGHGVDNVLHSCFLCAARTTNISAPNKTWARHVSATRGWKLTQIPQCSRPWGILSCCQCPEQRGPSPCRTQRIASAHATAVHSHEQAGHLYLPLYTVAEFGTATKTGSKQSSQEFLAC